MKQQLKSLKSKEMILTAGLALFSKQGYKATSMKEVSESAGISIGRVYHHFTGKAEIFAALLDEYWERLTDPALKLNVLSAEARFPDEFPELVKAIQQVVVENKAYIMLIYIDVIEFEGVHIRRFYKDMADRFRATYADRFEQLRLEGKLNTKADPLFAVMLVYRFFFQYFLVETSFGVEDHFGFDTDSIIAKAQEVILHGLLAKSEEA